MRLDYGGLRSLTAREIIAALTRDGFCFVRQTGSHQRYRRPDGRRVTVAPQGGGDTSANLGTQAANHPLCEGAGLHAPSVISSMSKAIPMRTIAALVCMLCGPAVIFAQAAAQPATAQPAIAQPASPAPVQQGPPVRPAPPPYNCEPVNPNATAEARALQKTICAVSGKGILSGQPQLSESTFAGHRQGLCDHGQVPCNLGLRLRIYRRRRQGFGPAPRSHDRGG